MGPERAVGRQRLGREHVEGRAGELAFVERPISIGLASLVLLVALFPLLAKYWRMRYPRALTKPKEALE